MFFCLAILYSHRCLLGNKVGALHWASPAFMVTGSGDSTVKAWDPRLDHRNGTCTATLRGHSGAVMCVSADVDRHRVVSGGVDKSVMTWDLRKTDQPLLVHAYSQVDFWDGSLDVCVDLRLDT